jgi:hypothetical protein
LTKQRRISRSLDFTEDDLATNQQGKLSEAQQKMLRRSLRYHLVGGGFLTFLFAFLLISGLSRQREWHILASVAVIVLFLMTVVCGFATVHSVRERQADLNAGTVLNITGVGEPYISSWYRGTPSYSLKIGGLEFRLRDPAHHAFYPGNTYQVFYTPNAKIIVSAIRLDDAPRNASIPG